MRRALLLLMFGGVLCLSFGIGSMTSPASIDKVSPAVRANTLIVEQPQAQTFSASYAYVSRDEMIATADAIVLGQVTNISVTQWNQDSGAYWVEEGLTTLPYHTVDIAISDVLVNTLGLGSAVTVTVLGGSPAGSSAAAGELIASRADQNLQVGDQGVFFVGQSYMAWRGGTIEQQATRPAILFRGWPQTSYLKLGSDNTYYSADPEERPMTLDKLRAKVRQYRQ